MDALDAKRAALHGYMGEVRAELGETGFLLNKYVYAVLDALNNTSNVSEAALSGFDTGMQDLYSIIAYIRNPEMNEGAHDHSFYPIALAYDEQHQIPRDEVYRYKMAVGLFPQYIRHCVTKHRAAYATYFQEALDAAQVENHRIDLEERIGEEMVARLDDHLFGYVLTLSPERVYAQGLMDNLIMTYATLFSKTGDIPV